MAFWAQSEATRPAAPFSDMPLNQRHFLFGKQGLPPSSGYNFAAGMDSKPFTNRLLSLDILRGFIIVVMALDHANALIAHGKLDPEMWTGLFPVYGEDWPAFITRAVTHLAAPGFFFLMGIGMALFSAGRSQLGWKPARIVSAFLRRGAMLIVFQFLLENPIWNLGAIVSGSTYFGVLFALGAGMILGSLLLRIPTPLLLGVSLLLLVGTQAMLPSSGQGFVSDAPLRTLLAAPGYSEIGARGIWVLYPVLPWLGVIGLGMLFGRWLLHNRKEALEGAFWLGAGSLLLFLLLRLQRGYGNIRPPEPGWIGFFNTVKYPPSLAFLSSTVGFNLVFLGLLQYAGRLERLGSPLAVFGRVPLFFYVTHLYFYGFLGLWLAPDGMPLASMVPLWLLGLLVLFPLCWLYGQARPRVPLLKYL